MFSSFTLLPFCNYYPEEEVFSTLNFIYALLEKPLTDTMHWVPGRLLYKT